MYGTGTILSILKCLGRNVRNSCRLEEDWKSWKLSSLPRTYSTPRTRPVPRPAYTGHLPTTQTSHSCINKQIFALYLQVGTGRYRTVCMYFTGTGTVYDIIHIQKHEHWTSRVTNSLGRVPSAGAPYQYESGLGITYFPESGSVQISDPDNDPFLPRSVKFGKDG